jgi:hypothetical protein
MSAHTSGVGIGMGSLPAGGSCEAFVARTRGGGTSERLEREATHEGLARPTTNEGVSR